MIWPYVFQTTSERGLKQQIALHLQETFDHIHTSTKHCALVIQSLRTHVNLRCDPDDSMTMQIILWCHLVTTSNLEHRLPAFP